ncbi:MAG: hypothetical protein AB2784_19955 [Candidatus Thiodiazotropha endolucinida]
MNTINNTPSIAKLLVSLALVFMVLLGCSPIIKHQSTHDTSAGYEKTILFTIENRLAKDISHSSTTITNDDLSIDTEYLSERPGSFRISTTNANSILPNKSIQHTLHTKYKWPLLGLKRQKSIRTTIDTTIAAILESEVESSCLKEDETIKVPIRLTPRPEFDYITLTPTVTSRSVSATVTPSIPRNGVFDLNLTGENIGSSNIIISTSSALISDITISSKTVPSIAPPTDLSDRDLTNTDNANPPPDIDNDTTKPWVLTWASKNGATKYTLQIFNNDDQRLYGALIDAPSDKFVAWLESGNYTWRIRAKVNTCQGTLEWTPFTSKQSFLVP